MSSHRVVGDTFTQIELEGNWGARDSTRLSKSRHLIHIVDLVGIYLERLKLCVSGSEFLIPQVKAAPPILSEDPYLIVLTL